MKRIADYEEVLADHRRLVRDLDVALNGEFGAAKQASLCDLIPQAAKMRAALLEIEEILFDDMARRPTVEARERVIDLVAKVLYGK